MGPRKHDVPNELLSPLVGQLAEQLYFVSELASMRFRSPSSRVAMSIVATQRNKPLRAQIYRFDGRTINPKPTKQSTQPIA